MSTSDRDKAEFMREVGATHAEWTETAMGGELLTKLTLGPTAPAQGPAARMAEWHQQQAQRAAVHKHDIMFAASSVKPQFTPPLAPPSAVPRAVRAKEAAAKRGQAR
ncbi:MAG TPA: hypothetical protein VM430_07645 [Microbacterium sp.]|nr:hypothetical protein [Microbacterium sp.]